jgi:hypothetical protein
MMRSMSLFAKASLNTSVLASSHALIFPVAASIATNSDYVFFSTAMRAIKKLECATPHFGTIEASR